jgi:hypothetical protein
MGREIDDDIKTRFVEREVKRHGRVYSPAPE